MKSLDRITYSPSKTRAQQAQFERIKAFQASLKPAKPAEVAKSAKIADKVELTSSFSGERKIEEVVTYKPLMHNQVKEIQELQQVIEEGNITIATQRSSIDAYEKALRTTEKRMLQAENDCNRLLDQHEADNVEFKNMEAHIAGQDTIIADLRRQLAEALEAREGNMMQRKVELVDAETDTSLDKLEKVNMEEIIEPVLSKEEELRQAAINKLYMLSPEDIKKKTAILEALLSDE